MTHADKCNLSSKCKLAGTEACTIHCGAYIAIHGLSGLGGRVGAANIPKDYLRVTMANARVWGAQPVIERAARKYASTFDRQFDPDGADQVKSLYLFSELPGTGKTTTAVALLNEWITVNYIGSLQRGLEPDMKPGVFLDVNEFQTEYNLAAMTHNEAEMEKIQTKIRQAQRAPFLVIDDIGVRSATEAFRAYIHAIVNHRVTNALPTVYTSNIPLSSEVPVDSRIEANKPYDIRDVFDHRLQDRMRDMCQNVTFGGESKRGKR